MEQEHVRLTCMKLKAAHNSNDVHEKELLLPLITLFMGLYSVNREIEIVKKFLHFYTSNWGCAQCSVCNACLFADLGEEELLTQEEMLVWSWNFKLNTQRIYPCIKANTKLDSEYIYSSVYANHPLELAAAANNSIDVTSSSKQTATRIKNNKRNTDISIQKKQLGCYVASDDPDYILSWDDVPPCLIHLREKCQLEHRRPHDNERMLFLSVVPWFTTKRDTEQKAKELDSYEPNKKKHKMLARTKAFYAASEDKRGVIVNTCMELAELGLCSMHNSMVDIEDTLSACHKIDKKIISNILSVPDEHFKLTPKGRMFNNKRRK